ncbi:aminotransferase class I/II-fold pyridoxal phosphate-dependent enzyme [Corynebacterium sp. 320]|uniref:cysteine-S-conjugate beta-lyase n=1 Tax=Corynebacterium zhongnanshanii TaxID=2768834 RepID=A0ABQ6VIZ0_9CORY|nr:MULTISPECIES: aminotransferase class I/II-fold pyridoxal phosphate-dependent enzyme [Corynebacterium]KAB1502405.1 aminotransferase class I/II-fold pyridoxal phosphate-dependent enzyme [Corynebacterium sp. 320]KAB1551373.1 aminotransferase class I/II-fold pyridoxal phosphate-dependent enzyme [Corynebacterium sp. 321]KAB1551798.1 aminotransferase class I/II-fold pyridoxal phosphate-dependent enzyme [Corynebacterium sp. 319]KAB3520914.1 aminotransferase class I/II-fold pyridoxal phosphate-depen
MSTPAGNPDAQITFPTLDQLRARGTMKWSRYPQDALPLWVAESDFETCPAVSKAINQAVDREYFGYHAEEAEVPPALAGFLQRRFQWEVDPSWIRVVPDVVKGVAVAIDELTPEGSDIINCVPSYYPFFDIPTATNRPSVLVEMVQRPKPGASDPEDVEWGFDYDALEEAFASTKNPHGVGSMILCNPYNPLGRSFRPEELERLVELADKYNVRLISDEIHAPVVYSPAQHTPTASISETAARVTVTVIASSKGWNTAGLRCAQMIFTNEEDRRTMAQVHNLRTGEASTLGMIATAAAYNEGEEWLDNELEYLSSNLDLIERRLPEVLPGARIIRPEASFLLWVDLRKVAGLADKPAAKILEKARVVVSEGTTFSPTLGQGHIRVNFATSQEILNEAFDRIAAADFSQEANSQ